MQTSSSSSPPRFQSLASSVKSLDDALKIHLDTMGKWYATQNIFVDSQSSQGSAPQPPKSDQSDPPTEKSPSTSLTPTHQQQSSNNNNNANNNNALTLSAQFGSRNRMRRNTKIPVAFDEAAIAKLRRPSANKATVTVRVVFMKIGVIDTIHDRYTAEVLIQSKWRESTFDNKKQSVDSIEWELQWNPRLSVENVIGEPKMKLSYAVSYDADDKATVIETRRINGQFFEFMELNQFPFDHQDLTVTVVSEQDVDRLEICMDQVEKCGINAQAFSAEQEWSLEQNVSTWKRNIPRTVNKMVVEYPALSVAAKASRRPQFFIWNIIIIMMAICSLAFATFTVNLETPQFRLQLTYILLLTTVTFKFVVNKSLPKISYLTYLDKYILGSMVILCGICVWHALVGSIIFNNLPKANENQHTTTIQQNSSSTNATNSTQQSTSSECPSTSSPGSECILVDKIALGILSSIYISFHLFFLALIIRSRRDEDDDNDGSSGQGDEDETTGASNHQNGFQINIDATTQASSAHA